MKLSHWSRCLTLSVVILLAGCAGTPSSRTPVRKVVLDPQMRSEVVMTAMGLMDSEYRYGGTHPERGFDCSGLVAYVFSAAASQPLPHNTEAIAQVSTPISKSRLKAGDFVFFNTLNRPYSHMGIYIGNGQFVNAPSSGGRVRIDSLSSPYFAKRFESARTVFAQ